MRERGPDRGRRADADGAGGEVDGVGVLEPAGVALQAALLAQPPEVGGVEVAEEVVDGVQHRRGVRLDRHPVVALQLGEPQGGHDVDHRRARRLVAADLHPRRVGPAVVGDVDDRRGDPADALGHLAQGRGDVGGGGGREQLGHRGLARSQDGRSPSGSPRAFWARAHDHVAYRDGVRGSPGGPGWGCAAVARHDRGRMLPRRIDHCLQQRSSRLIRSLRARISGAGSATSAVLGC